MNNKACSSLIHRLALLAVLTVVTTLPSWGAISTWTGLGGDANWTTPANWTAGAPISGNSLVFDVSAQTAPNNDFAAGTAFGGIAFPSTAAAFTLGGNAISLSGLVENSSSSAQVLALPLNIIGLTTFNTVSGDIDVTGVVGGTNNVVKTGGGALTLNLELTPTNPDRYTGYFTASNGVLVLKDSTGDAYNANGNHQFRGMLAGGDLQIEYNSWWSDNTVDMAANAKVGVGTGRRYDFAGYIGDSNNSYTITKTGAGLLNMVNWRSDLYNVHARALYVSEGTLGCLRNGGDIVQWGGTNVPIVVSNGAALWLNSGDPGTPHAIIAPNPSITLYGGAGLDGRGMIVTDVGDPNGSATLAGNIALNGDTTLGTFGGGRLVLAGNITGTGPITKLGATTVNSKNVLVLGGTNSWSGGLTINTGIVQLASSSALPSGISINLANDGTLDLGGFNATVSALTDDTMGSCGLDNSGTNASTLTVGGGDQQLAISGPVKNSGGYPLNIVKMGSQPATLMGANTFKGDIIINGGSMELNIPTGSGTNGQISLAAGTSLTAHKTGSPSAFRAYSMTLGGNNTLSIDLSGFGNPSTAPFTVTNGAGTFSASGNTVINISANESLMAMGQFAIIRYSTRSGSGTFSLGTLPNNIVATLVTNASGKSIDLKITSAPVTTWVGNVSTDWDTTTANWSVLGVASTYVDGRGVYFPDGAVRTSVNIANLYMPAGTLVNAAANYTFDGPGGIYNGDLSKDGTGTLTLLTANNYNNTIISGGTVQVGNGGYTGTLGSGPSVQNDGVLAINRADDFTLAAVLAGAGSLRKAGTNMLYLGGANTYSGGTYIDAGGVQISTPTALGSPGAGLPLATVASGAALDLNGNYPAVANPLIISGSGLAPDRGALFNSGGGAAVWGLRPAVQNLTLNADVSLASPNSFSIGILSGNYQGFAGGTLVGNNHSIFVGGPGAVYIGAAVSGVTQWIFGGGGACIAGQNPFGTGTPVVLTNGAWLDSWGPSGGTYSIANNITVGAGGATIRNTQGSWWGRFDYDTYTGSILLNDTLTLQHGPYGQVANNPGPGRLFISGPISGPAGILKTGPLPVTLSGANTYTGATIVTNGSLAISAMTTGGGAYTVYDGATLDVPAQVGGATLNMSSLTLGSGTGATLNMGRVFTLSSTPAITVGTLTLVGQTMLILSPGVFAVPGQYPLIKYSGSIAGGGSIVLGTPGVRGLPGSLVMNSANNSIDLLVPSGSPVLWTASANNIWDIGSTANFSYQGSSTTYQETTPPGDAVTFNDSAANTAVSVSATVSPSMIVVSNATKDYTFTGSIIAGTGGLLKQGPGSLFVNNGANTFSGGTTIAGGTVKLGNAASLNSAGAITINSGATLDLNSMDANGTTVYASGSGVNGAGAIVNSGAGNQNSDVGTINMTGSLTIGGTNEWNLRNGAKTLNCPTNAYSLTKVGSSTIKFANNPVISPNLGDIYILGGELGFEGTGGYGDTSKTIYIGNGGTLGWWQSRVPCTKSIICSNGAAFDPYSGGGTGGTQYNVVAGPVYLAELGNNMGSASGRVTIAVNWQGAMTFSNTISGPGWLWVEWNGDVTFAAPNTFTGDFETAGRVRLLGNATLSPTNNVTVNNPDGACLVVQDNASVNGQHLRLWNGSPTNGLVVSGNGKINSTSIEVGNFIADFTGAAGGAYALQSGQTLRIDNGARIKGNVTAASGSTVSPGGGWWIQNTGYMTNNLTLQAGSTTWMDISMDGGVPSSDAFGVLGTLTYGGTLRINRIGTNSLVAGDTFKLFSGGTYAGSFTSVLGDTGGQFLTWDISKLPVDGTIKVLSATASSIPTIASGVAGGMLNISWPADHTGWRLLVQTNNLGAGISSNPADWGTVPGSTTVNSVSLPIESGKPTEFYRLTFP